MDTTQITIRNVDKRLKQLIDKNAKKQNKSINQYVLDVMRDRVEALPGQRPWEVYAGQIPNNAFHADITKDFEAIDASMWQ